MNEHLFDKDVHTEHCSLLSCKYMDDACTVRNGTRISVYPPYDDDPD